MTGGPPPGRRADADRRRRWASSHGAMRGAATRRAREGVADAELVVDPAARLDPAPRWERMRSHHPFAPGPLPGMLATAHHEVAREVLASDAFVMPAGVASGAGGAPGPQDPPSLIALDGAAHAHRRTLLAGTFTARRIADLTPRVEAIATRLLDDLPAATAPDGVVDLVAAYAHPLPLAVITELLGLPADGGPLPPDLPRWGDAVVSALDTARSWEEFDAGEDDLYALRAWLRGQVAAAVERGPDGSGLLARLVTDPGSHAPGDDGLLITLMFLLAAGFETTTHLLSAGAVTLAAAPHHVAALRADPSGWPRAVDELLRHSSPVTRALRRAGRDVDVAGTTVPAGTVVIVHVAAANHDPAVFTDPDTFDPDRADARSHLAFGRGPHHCLGAALARLEGAVGLRVLLDRFPGLHPVGPGTRRPTTLVDGRATLPVRTA